ncbi:MAG: hypothetical protein ABI462_12120 [Ignavibacteria bacterium]
MSAYIKSNIEKIKKTASAAALAIILSISCIIIINTLRISDDFNLFNTNNVLRHLIEDHKANDNNFHFIKIKQIHVNYFETGSASEMNVAAATSLFLIPFLIVVNFSPGKKYFAREKSLFADGFKNSSFRPPKHSH